MEGACRILVESAQKLVSILAATRNAAIPLHQLPVEVIQRILCASNEPKPHQYRLRRVCRYWHDIIESMPQFWSKLNCGAQGPGSQFRASLVRSEAHGWLIKVIAADSLNLSPEVLRLSTRWATLDWCGDTLTLEQALSRIHLLPNLQQLALKSGSGPASIPKVLLCAPNLRRLDLTDTSGLVSMIPILPQIHYLRLVTCTICALRPIVDALAACRNIRELCIRLDRGNIEDLDTIPFDAVEAPFLQSFRLSGSSNCHLLLRVLRPPHYATLSITMRGRDFTQTLDDSIFPELRTSLGFWMPQTLYETRLRMEYRGDYLSIYDVGERLRMRVAFLDFSREELITHPILVGLEMPLPRHVTLQRPIEGTRLGELSSISSILPDVTFLNVGHMYVGMGQPVHDLLGPRRQSDEVGGTPPPEANLLFPKVVTLITRPNPGEDNYDSLVRLCEARSGTLQQLTVRLHARDPRVPDDTRGTIRKLIPNVNFVDHAGTSEPDRPVVSGA